MKNPEKVLGKIEQIFGAAEEAIKATDTITIEDDIHPEREVIITTEEYDDITERVENTLSSATANFDNPQYFDFLDLKKDFLIAKRNLRKLIAHGQRLMDTSAGMSLDEMTATQIQAVAQLSDSVTNQLQLMITLYKDITEIQKNLTPSTPGNLPAGATVQGNVVTNNVLFQGDTSQLMKLINGSKISK